MDREPTGTIEEDSLALEPTRVRPNRTRGFDLIVSIVGLLVVAAILKPWQTDTPGQPLPSSVPVPSRSSLALTFAGPLTAVATAPNSTAPQVMDAPPIHARPPARALGAPFGRVAPGDPGGAPRAPVVRRLSIPVQPF
jgi:hypothetical protein